MTSGRNILMKAFFPPHPQLQRQILGRVPHSDLVVIAVIITDNWMPHFGC
uniref:Uncharacterized protein n=1 Tax=Arion vulgaris TaxID=1028688 RepID=A0A0B7BCP0_9EUPU